MPDVTVKCPECGADRVVSEYASVDSFSCLVCQAALEMPGKKKASAGGLKIKRNPGPRSVPMILTQSEEDATDPDDEDPITAAAAAAAAPKVDVHEGRAEEAKSKVWLGYLGFAVVSVLLIGFQWKHNDFSQYETYYIWARNLFVLGSYLMVVLVAFQDNTAIGAVCLLFPPYTLLYVSGHLESYLLRGVFLASVLALGTEIYFYGDASALASLEVRFERFVDTVDGLIKKASE